MIAPTDRNSIESWEWFQAKGLSKRVKDICRIMSDGELRDQRMINDKVRSLPGNEHIRDQAIQPRVCMMERMELLEGVEDRPDPTSGRTSRFYRFTFKPPIMTMKEATELSRKQSVPSLLKRIKELEAENETLRAQLAEAQKPGQLTFL